MQFSNTIGHEKQKKLFGEIVRNGQLGHAYAFVGDAHIGKTTFALELAKLLGADLIMDTVIYDEDAPLPIEAARNLQARLSLTPSGSCKVAIVADAQDMTLSAANSLLKILEEPPARSLIILATSNFYSLLPTIASRVRRVNFAPASSQELDEALLQKGIDKAVGAEVWQYARGRIGLALRLAQDPLLFQAYQANRQKYGILESGTLLERLKAASALAELEGAQLRGFLLQAMEQWAQNASALPLGRKLLEAWRDLRYNLNTKLVLDNLFMPPV